MNLNINVVAFFFRRQCPGPGHLNGALRIKVLDRTEKYIRAIGTRAKQPCVSPIKNT